MKAASDVWFNEFIQSVKERLNRLHFKKDVDGDMIEVNAEISDSSSAEFPVLRFSGNGSAPVIINGVAYPFDPNDSANKEYVDDKCKERVTYNSGNKEVHTVIVDMGTLSATGLVNYNTGIRVDQNPTFLSFDCMFTDGEYTRSFCNFTGGETYLWNNGNNWYVNFMPAGDCSAWKGTAFIKYFEN